METSRPSSVADVIVAPHPNRPRTLRIRPRHSKHRNSRTSRLSSARAPSAVSSSRRQLPCLLRKPCSGRAASLGAVPQPFSRPSHLRHLHNSKTYRCNTCRPTCPMGTSVTMTSAVRPFVQLKIKRPWKSPTWRARTGTWSRWSMTCRPLWPSTRISSRVC